MLLSSLEDGKEVRVEGKKSKRGVIKVTGLLIS
jgi:hypothetical protein